MPTVEKAASDYTDYVKKRATVVGRREFSDSLFNSLVLQSSVGRGLGNTPDVPPAPDGEDYGVMTFAGEEYLGFPTLFLPQNFTVECFFRVSEFYGGQQLWIFTNLDLEPNYVGTRIQNESLQFQTNLENGVDIAEVSIDTWYHCAVSRSGTTFYVSLNGTIVHSQTTDIDLSISYLYAIGNGSGYDNSLLGSISNFRISNTAKYTTDFTVPSLPLQSDANTLLLLLAKSASTVGVDSSSYNRIAEGTCGWEPAPPFFFPYGIFSGFSSTNYLSYPNLNLGDGIEFPRQATFEFFFKSPDVTTTQAIFNFSTGGIADEAGFGQFSILEGNLIFYMYGFGVSNSYTYPNLRRNTWYHCAWNIDGTDITISVNGVTSNVIGNGPGGNTHRLTIGAGIDGQSPFLGYLTNFRISNFRRYTEPTFPIPGLGFTPQEDYDLLLLLAKEGEEFVDSSINQNEVTGTCTWSLGPI